MRTFLRGKTWWMDFRNAEGLRVKKTTGTSSKIEAKAIAESISTKIREGKFFDKRISERIQFRDFMAQLLQEEANQRDGKASRFSEWAGRKLNPYFGEFFLEDITDGHIERYRGMRLRTVGKNTINREHAVLKKVLNKAKRRRLITENPACAVKLFKVPRGRIRYLTADEKLRLRAVCSPRIWDVAVMGMQVGLVGKDLFLMKKSQVDFVRNLVVLERCKTGQPVEIPMTPDVRAILSRLCFGVEDNGFLFRKKDGSPYGDNRLALRRAILRAGLKDFRPYDFRHTFATDLVSAGVDIFTVSKLLGHTSVKTTMIYAHMAPDHRQKEMKLLESYLGHQEGTKKEQPQEAVGNSL